METSINTIPKRLTHDAAQFPSFIVDENGRPVCQAHNALAKPEIKQAIIDRYNNYEVVKSCLIIVSSFALVLLTALIFK